MSINDGNRMVLYSFVGSLMAILVFEAAMLAVNYRGNRKNDIFNPFIF